MHKKIRLNAAATAGLLIILFFLIIAVFAPVIAPYDPKEMIASYLPPSKEHILGTNDVGQDIFSEMVYGTRVSLNPGKWSLIIAISITAWTGTARILRARVMQLKELPFIKIEKTMGVHPAVILFKHILPNIKDIILTRGAMAISGAMMTEAGLSFLGLGEFGEKSWGSVLHYAFFRNSIMKKQYWWYVPPIVCICVCVLGFMLIGYYGKIKKGGE